jgi:hypothetical protein
MACLRSPDQEAAFRFEMFASILGDVVKTLDDNTSDEPLLRGPTTLLDYIEDELAIAEPFRSQNNAEYVRDHANDLLSDPVLANDPQLLPCISDVATAASAIAAMNGGERVRNARALLASPTAAASKLIDGGRYFEVLLDRLIDQICKAPMQSVGYDDLRLSAQGVVFAFQATGFSLEAIGSFSRRLASIPYTEYQGNVIHDLPVSVSLRGYLAKERFDRHAYNQAVKQILDGYTIADRLRALDVWYRQPPLSLTIIARIEGLSLAPDVKVGNVLFYQPLAGRPRFVRCSVVNKQMDWELFHEPGWPNAAVDLKARDHRAAQRQGLELITEALDLLGLHFSHRLPLSAKVGHSLTVDRWGHLSSSRSEIDMTAPQVRQHFSLNLSAFDALFLEGMLRSEQRITATASPDRDRIRDAMRTLRRATEAEVLEDRLLGGWMSLEALLGDDAQLQLSLPRLPLRVAEKRIAALIGAVAANSYRTDLSVALYQEVERALGDQTFNQHSDFIDAPSEVLIEAGFGPQATVEIKIADFVPQLRSLAPFIRQPLLQAKVVSGLKFYEDAAVALSRLRLLRAGAAAEATIIYQMRNRLVHQAKRRPEVLEYYASRSTRYASMILRALMLSPATLSNQAIFQGQLDDVETLLYNLAQGDIAALSR